MLSKFYLQNWRWVFSSTLDLNQTTAKETTSSFSPFYHYIYYCIGILKLHSLFIPCHHHPPFADSTLLQPVFMFFPTCNVFAKGRLRSESRHEDHHVIRLLWYYVCWNCLSTRKRKKIVAQKNQKQPCYSCTLMLYTILGFSSFVFYRISNCEWRFGKNTKPSCGTKWFETNGFLEETKIKTTVSNVKIRILRKIMRIYYILR